MRLRENAGVKIACAVLVAVVATGCTNRSTKLSDPPAGPSYLVSGYVTKPPFNLIVEIRGPDGKVRRVVSKGTGGDGDARWSPTGSMLAWVDRLGLHVARGDGSKPRLLVRRERCTIVCNSALTFAWSPDGRRLLVGDAGKQDTRLLVVDAQTGEAKSLVDPRPFVLYEAIDWAPNGSWIAYSRSSGEPGTNTCCDDGLYISRPDGSRARRLLGLADPIHDSEYAAFSPDGRSLAVGTCCDAAPQFGIVDLESGHIERIRSIRADDQIPQWSPDSKLLAEGLVIFDRRGRVVRRLTTAGDVRRWTGRGALVIVVEAQTPTRGPKDTVLMSPDARSRPRPVFRLPPRQSLLAIDAR